MSLQSNRFGRRRLALLFAFVGLGCVVPGCTLGPAFDPNALQPIPTGQSRLIFYVGTSSPLMPVIGRDVEVDQLKATVGSGEFVVFDLPPGLRRVTFRPTRIRGNSLDLTFPVDLRVGQTVYARFFSVGGQNRTLFYGTVEERLAIKEMQGMSQKQISAP